MAKKSNPHWMEEAFARNPGKLHRELGVKEGEKIPARKLDKARTTANKTGNSTLKRELNLAERGREASKGRKK